MGVEPFNQLKGEERVQFGLIVQWDHSMYVPSLFVNVLLVASMSASATFVCYSYAVLLNQHNYDIRQRVTRLQSIPKQSQAKSQTFGNIEEKAFLLSGCLLRPERKKILFAACDGRKIIQILYGSQLYREGDVSSLCEEQVSRIWK